VLVTHRRYQMATLSKDKWKDIEKLTNNEKRAAREHNSAAIVSSSLRWSGCREWALEGAVRCS
jgi:hypothetical protein